MKNNKDLQASLLLIIILFCVSFISRITLGPLPHAQLAQVLSATGIGPYSYSGTLVDLGSGAELDNLETQGNGGMSVAFWITANSSAASGIISKGMMSNTSGSWQINRSTQTTPNRISFIKEGATDLSALRNSAIPIGTRTHVVVTYDGSMLRSGVKFYINGTLLPDAGGGADGATANSDAASNLVIGGGPSVTSLDGTLEDVRIYNRIISSSEISSLAGVSGGSGGTGGGTTEPPPPPPPPTTGVTPVNGVYAVNAAGGTNTFTTIQACANVVKAGETCLVQAGNYPERVVVKNAGTQGSPVTFKASGTVVMQGFDATSKPYTTIDGFEITNTPLNVSGIIFNGSPNSKAINNYIHHTIGNAHGIFVTLSDNSEISNNRTIYTSGVGIRLSSGDGALSKNVKIRGNTVSWASYIGNNKFTNSYPGIQPAGSHNLVENNDISHVPDFITYGNSDHLVIRNNTFRDVLDSDTDAGPHIDGVQGWGNYVLVENNRMYNVHEIGGNAHFVLFANDAASKYGVRDSTDAIVRYNTVSDIDSSFSITQYGFKWSRIYNNTVFSINAKANGIPIGYTHGSTDGKTFNNIFSDAVGRSYLSSYYYTTDSYPGGEVDYNLSWKSLCGTTCGVWNTRSPYIPPPGSEAHAIFNKDPLFLGSNNFNLQSSSPAIDKGGPLTRVATGDVGSGTSLVVTDAGMFQDGWAGTEADWIAVGSPGNVAQISSISGNTVTLRSSISRTVGDPVYLFKDSSGRQVLYGNAPDMGAYESTYSSGTTPVTSKPGDFDGNGIINSLDVSRMASAWNTNNSIYDLIRDSIINTLDFSVVVQNWTR